MKAVKDPGRWFRLMAVGLAVSFNLTCSQKNPLDPTRSPEGDVLLLVDMQASSEAIAVGGAQAHIRVRLVDQHGVPRSNHTVSFTTTLGVVTLQDNTDANGYADAVLTSGVSAGTALVRARYGDASISSIEISILSYTGAGMIMQVSPSSVLANGEDHSMISVTVHGDSAKPVAGGMVRFSTSWGQIASSMMTDENGQTSVSLRGEASLTDVTAHVTATYDTLTREADVIFEGVELTVGASPSSILADGQSTSQVTAILKKSASKVAIPNVTIIFGTDLGTIASQAITNSEGVARASLTSGRTLGTAVVMATYGHTLNAVTSVLFLESVPSFLQASANPTILPADGQSQSVIQATVTDAHHHPVPDGTVVQYSIIQGTGSIENQAPTAGGIASSTLTSSTTPGVLLVRVSCQSLADTVSVTCSVGSVHRISVAATPPSLPADGITKSLIRAAVFDAQNNPVEGVIVEFTASIGNIIGSVRSNASGFAETEFSSTAVGLATITARAGSLSGFTTVQVIPGPPFSMTLSYAPHFMYVRECGKNQTVTIFADVRDEKNNPVADGTYVLFSIYASPGEGDALSSENPLPTVGGIAQVSYTSGIRSGTVRIKAEVTDASGTPVSPFVSGISTEIMIYSGPPFIEDTAMTDSTDTHMTVVTSRLNIWAWVDTTVVTILVGDKYNNPVQEGTAVYLTTSGGVVTTRAYTDENGIANVLLQSGNPQPTIGRYYDLKDPNLGTVIPGPVYDPALGEYRLPDYELSQVTNSKGELLENDGITRLMAYAEGVDGDNQPALVWDWTSVIFSRGISHFEVYSSADTLHSGELATITFEVWDSNGNPIVSGSEITASYAPQAAAAELSWTEKTTGDPGQCYYSLALFNTIKPTDPDAHPSWVTVTVSIQGTNGNTEKSVAVYLDL